MNHPVARCRRFLRQLKLGHAHKLVVAAVGGSVVLVGVAMVVLPGPAVVVIPLGLAILATEFLWARRWFKRARALLPHGDPPPPVPRVPAPAEPMPASPSNGRANDGQRAAGTSDKAAGGTGDS